MQAETTRLGPAEGAQHLVELIMLFLEEPNPDIQHKMTLFHADHYLTILNDSSKSREVKIACCSAFKQALGRRNDFSAGFELILGSVQALYLSGNEDLCNPLQIILERLFQMYLDDEKKLQAFEGVVDRLGASRDTRISIISKRALRIATLLVRSMAPPTLNNQVCVGGLFCYLKQIYYTKNQTNIPYDPSGQGIKLLLQGMQQKQMDPYNESFFDVQIEVVKLIGEIVDRVEEEESEQPEVIPALYMQNSKEIQALLTQIICASSDTKIYGLNEKINQLKAQLLELYSNNYLYRVQRSFLMRALATITSTQVAELTDCSMQIVTSLLLLIERSTSFGEYSECFFGVTQALVLKLFEMVAARDAQKDALENDPQYFAEIAEDFCKTQDSQTMKAKAGSLIYNLCLYIDGNLTFVANFALISLLDLERRAVLALAPHAQLRPDVARSQGAMKTLMDLWSFGDESFTETSILVLSSVSDLLTKRKDFDYAIRQHLSVMLNIFRLREQVQTFFPPIILCRYVQLVSYFSAVECLDPFVPLFGLHEGVAQTLLKALETVIHFHDKKDMDMTNYVAGISAKILLLSDRLTPLLQSTVISRPELLQCVKQRLIEKMVLWLLNYIQNANVFASNKISNLLCKVISYYPDYLSKVEEQLCVFQLQALAQYLTPLYRYLISGEQRQSEHCVVDVAVSHAQIIKTAMSEQLAADFLKIGISVVERNQGVLNKSLELFSQLLGALHMKTLISQKQYTQLRKINLLVAGQLLPKIHEWLRIVEFRDDNIWQLACLAEITLATFEATMEVPNKNFLDFSHMLQACRKSASQVVKIKGFNVAFLVLRLCPEQLPQCEKWIMNEPLPNRMPPWQKDHICVYILRCVCSFSSAELRARLTIYALTIMLPEENLQKYFTEYENRIHCVGSNTDECEVAAYQTSKEVRHPLECWPTDIFQQFRMMFLRMGDWQPLRAFLPERAQKQIRRALQMRTVGARVRRIVRVKPLKL